MVTFNLNQVLIVILLIALIVLTIFLIVLAKNANQAVKKANTLLDDGVETVENIKKKYDDIKDAIEKSKIISAADSGLHLIKVAVKKARKRKG